MIISYARGLKKNLVTLYQFASRRNNILSADSSDLEKIVYNPSLPILEKKGLRYTNKSKMQNKLLQTLFGPDARSANDIKEFFKTDVGKALEEDFISIATNSTNNINESIKNQLSALKKSGGDIAVTNFFEEIIASHNNQIQQYKNKPNKNALKTYTKNAENNLENLRNLAKDIILSAPQVGGALGKTSAAREPAQKKVSWVEKISTSTRKVRQGKSLGSNS